jgi:uncharacterized protein (TIGR02996 family)
MDYDIDRLLDAMRANPKDIALRLAYADRLDELGHAAAAEFVRRHCEIYPLPVWHPDRQSKTAKPYLEAATAAGQVFPAGEVNLDATTLDLRIETAGGRLFVYRGLVDRFKGDLDGWVRGMDADLRWHPVRQATVWYTPNEGSLVVAPADGTDGPDMLTVAVAGTEPLGRVPVPAGDDGLNEALTQLLADRWPATRFRVRNRDHDIM